MAQKNIEQLYTMILQDEALQQKLKAAPNLQSQVRLVLEIGREKGYRLEAADVEAFFKENEGALSDETLDLVAGGQGPAPSSSPSPETSGPKTQP